MEGGKKLKVLSSLASKWTIFFRKKTLQFFCTALSWVQNHNEIPLTDLKSVLLCFDRVLLLPIYLRYLLSGETWMWLFYWHPIIIIIPLCFIKTCPPPSPSSLHSYMAKPPSDYDQALPLCVCTCDQLIFNHKIDSLSLCVRLSAHTIIPSNISRPPK